MGHPSLNTGNFVSFTKSESFLSFTKFHSLSVSMQQTSVVHYQGQHPDLHVRPFIGVTTTLQAPIVEPMWH